MGPCPPIHPKRWRYVGRKRAVAVRKMGKEARAERFAEEFLNNGGIASRAARACGIDPAHGVKLLKSPLVERALQDARERRRAMANVTAEELLFKLRSIANTTIRDVAEITEETIEQEGKPPRVRRSLRVRSFEDLTEEQLQAIESVQETKEGIKVKLYSRKDALDSLGRHLGFFNADKSNGSGAVADAIRDAVDALTDTQRAARIAALLERARARRDGRTLDEGSPALAAPAGAADGGVRK